MKKLLSTFILFIVLWTNSKGQVLVTPGVFPFMCQGNGFVTQTSPIVIAEQSVTGFQTATAGTYICYEINAPANYQFKAGVGTVTFHSGSDVTAVHSLATDITANYMLFYYECPTNTKFDTIRISGLQMRALSGAASSATLLKAVGCDYMTGNYYSNAQNHGTLNSTSNPAPTITYSPEPYYCSADNTPYTLTGTPSGGTFSGTGVTSNNFNPFGLSAGADIITYTVNNGGGCSNSSTLSLTVETTPTVSILSDDADNIICPNTSVTFTASASGSNQRYQFLKNGIPVTTLSTTNTYTTTTLANNDQISVEADNGNFSCQNTSSAIIMTVTANPNATVSVPTLPALKCSNDNTSYPISTSPSGLGTISGSGVSGNNFIISSAAIGINTITYNVVASGCNFPVTTNVTVTQAPSVTLTSSDADNIICEGDLITFTANTSGTANRYWFLKNNTGTQGPNGVSSYVTSALLNLDAISVSVDNGVNTCVTTTSAITTSVGKIPKAKFKLLNTCGTNDVIYTDLSVISSGSITNWKWDFDTTNNVDPINSSQNPTYTFPSPGDYYTRLTVTSNLGCKDSTIKKLTTYPAVTVTSNNPYIADFNISPSFWNFDGDSLPSWGWGVFNPPIDTNSRKIVTTQNVWHTGNNASGLYNGNERSFLSSPCFNLSGLEKPMIAIKMGLDTDASNAGAILEASSNGGVSWNRVGNIGDGQHWYENPGNNGLPGGYGRYSNFLAWSGHYDTTSAPDIFNGWQVARIKLDSLAGKTGIRFRIAFGAKNGVIRYTGIALDSIWIGDRNKRVMIEHFTNNLEDNVKDPGFSILQAKNAINYIRDQRPKDVSAVYYHCSFPGIDNYNAFFPAGPSSRVLYYGVTKAPTTVADGTYYNGNVYSGGTNATRFDLQDVDARILEHAIFRLDISTFLTPGQVKTAVKIIYNENNSFANDVILQTVIVEDSADGNIKNQSSVVRQMLDDAAGEYISRTWNKNDSTKVVKTWNYDTNLIPSSAKLGVVAFLQNASTKEIYQSVYIRGQGNVGSIVNNIYDGIFKDGNMVLFPNPASDELSLISLSDEEEIESCILFDNLGHEVKAINPEQPLRIMKIDLTTIVNGIYLVKVQSTNGKTYLKKIIVQK